MDVEARTVSLRLLAYPSQKASERIAVEIVFSDVQQVQSLADFVQLGANRDFGNVNHWHIADGPGASYFYLAEGCLIITAATAPVLIRR